jgi:hypothetical protein
MNQNIPAYYLLIALVVAGAAYFIHKWVAAIQMSIRHTTEASAKLEADLTALRQSISAAVLEIMKLLPAAEEIKTNLPGVPKLLEAVARVGQAQLELNAAQRAEQKARQDNPFGRPNAPAPPRDTAAANLEYEVSQMMRSEGVTREEALLRLNSANADSVWAGGSLLEGWQR